MAGGKPIDLPFSRLPVLQDLLARCLPEELRVESKPEASCFMPHTLGFFQFK